MRLALTNGLLLTQDVRDRVIPNGIVIVEDARITFAGPADEAPVLRDAEVIDATNCAVLPGLVNCHTHASQILLRGGISHSRTLYDWLTNVVMPGLAVYTRDDLRLAIQLYCAEAIRAGVTTIVTNEEPDPADPEGFARVALDAFVESGLRVVYAYLYRDTTPEVVWEGVPEKREQSLLALPSLDPTFTVIERLARDYPAATDGRVRAWPSPATTAVVSPAGLQRARDLAASLTGGWALHLAETRTEHNLRSNSPVQHLESLGCLDERLLARHCVHVDAADIALMARRGTRVSTQPVSNCYLGSGIAPVPAMLEAGVTVGLGTDDANCNDSINPFADMKTLALIHRGATTNPAVIAPERVLRMATSEAAAAVGMAADIGSLEPGKRADIITVRLDQPQMTPLHSPHAALVFQAYGSEVDTVIVDGRVLMADRRTRTGPPVETLLPAASAASRDVLRRAGLEHLAREELL